MKGLALGLCFGLLLAFLAKLNLSATMITRHMWVPPFFSGLCVMPSMNTIM